MPRVRLKHAEILKIREERQHHLSPNVSDLDLVADAAQMLDRTDAVRRAISDKTGGLVIPLGKQKVDRFSLTTQLRHLQIALVTH